MSSMRWDRKQLLPRSEVACIRRWTDEIGPREGALTKVKTSAGAYLPRSAVAPSKIMGVRAANIDLGGRNG